MSNQTEIERLETARDKIRTALINFGIADESAKLDALAKKIAAIRVQEATTITPSKTEQTAVYPQRYTKGAITVAPIPNKYQDVSEVTTTADEVLEGNKFVDKNGNVVTGTMPICASYDAILDTTTTTHMIPAGYHEGDGSVSIVLEEKTVTPTDTQQIITPSEGCVLSKVTVEAASGGGGVETYTGTVCEKFVSPFGMAFTICYTNGSGEYLSQSISGSTPVSITVAKNTIVFCYNENSVPEIAGAEIIFTDGHYRVILPTQDGFSIRQT